MGATFGPIQAQTGGAEFRQLVSLSVHFLRGLISLPVQVSVVAFQWLRWEADRKLTRILSPIYIFEYTHLVACIRFLAYGHLAAHHSCMRLMFSVVQLNHN